MPGYVVSLTGAGGAKPDFRCCCSFQIHEYLSVTQPRCHCHYTHMDRNTLFTKTAKGLMEATGKTSILARDLRNLLKEIDGKLKLGQLNEKLDKYTDAKLKEALGKLAKDGFIKEFLVASRTEVSPPVSRVAPPSPQSPSPDDDGDDLDFTSIAPARPVN